MIIARSNRSQQLLRSKTDSKKSVRDSFFEGTNFKGSLWRISIRDENITRNCAKMFCKIKGHVR